MGAPQRNRGRHHCNSDPTHSQHPHRCRNRRCLRDRLFRLRALRVSVTGRRVYFAWCRSTCHLGSGIAARAGSCRTWSPS
jgi:hypothetical protein